MCARGRPTRRTIPRRSRSSWRRCGSSPPEEPGEQWHLGGLRENAQARLRAHHADTRRSRRPRSRRRVDRGSKRQPPALRAEDALATRVHRSSNRSRLSVRRNGGKIRNRPAPGPRVVFPRCCRRLRVGREPGRHRDEPVRGWRHRRVQVPRLVGRLHRSHCRTIAASTNTARKKDRRRRLSLQPAPWGVPRTAPGAFEDNADAEHVRDMGLDGSAEATHGPARSGSGARRRSIGRRWGARAPPGRDAPLRQREASAGEASVPSAAALVSEPVPAASPPAAVSTRSPPSNWPSTSSPLA